ncbi:MAG: hypothetical protein L0H64_14770, partial [Pseudonocardia sp.]|nr:hypothetical protein [Pseudonocardia sp.]
APDHALQRISGRRVTADVYRYDLRRLGDTVRAAGLVTMWLDLPGQEAKVAFVRGADPVATGIGWTAGRLRLLGRRPRGALAVRVRCAHAPWLAAFTGRLDEGATEVELPAPFREGGPLIVTVLPEGAQVPDGWVDPGSLPRAVVMFRVGPEDQVPALQSPVAGAMAGYLAGRGPIPESTDALHLLWIAAARAPVTCLPALAGVTAQECASRLGAHPVAALSAVARAGLDTSAVVGPLVRSGLSAHPLRRVDDPGAVQRLWAAAPLPALLLTSPLLSYLTADPAWDPAELDPAEERLLDELRTRCSPAALDILATGTTRTGARFDPAVDVSEPRGIATPAADDLEQLNRFATGSIHAIGIGAALNGRPPAGTLSLGCALAARLAAHGDRTAAGIERHLRHAWVAITRDAPLMVADDIAHAELLATHWNTHSKEPSP